MKIPNKLLLVTKIVAILIVIGYAVGLFMNHDIAQASVMTFVAILVGLDLVFSAKRATNDKHKF